MRGGSVTTLEYLMSDVKRGALIARKAGANTIRAAYCSDEFRIKHPVVYDMLSLLPRQPGGKWRWLSSTNEVAKIAL
eukprot:1087703-Alexandrium_andersonii.AAC.1